MRAKSSGLFQTVDSFIIFQFMKIIVATNVSKRPVSINSSQCTFQGGLCFLVTYQLKEPVGEGLLPQAQHCIKLTSVRVLPSQSIYFKRPEHQSRCLLQAFLFPCFFFCWAPWPFFQSVFFYSARWHFISRMAFELLFLSKVYLTDKGFSLSFHIWD